MKIIKIYLVMVVCVSTITSNYMSNKLEYKNYYTVDKHVDYSNLYTKDLVGNI